MNIITRIETSCQGFEKEFYRAEGRTEAETCSIPVKWNYELDGVHPGGNKGN